MIPIDGDYSQLRSILAGMLRRQMPLWGFVQNSQASFVCSGFALGFVQAEARPVTEKAQSKEAVRSW